jgi:signal transduction histidine kinase
LRVAKLTVVAGPDAGAECDLDAPRVGVGRHSSNALALRDERVSRRHLELRKALSGGHQLFDLQSGNGTRVNGRLVQVIDLRPGDRVELGDTVLLYGTGSETTAYRPEPPDATRLVVQPAGDASVAVRTVAADAGSRLLRRPAGASTEWLRGRLASLTALYEASSAVSRIADVGEMLARLLDVLLQATGAAHGCALLLDAADGSLEPGPVRGGTGAGREFVVSRTIADHVVKSGEGVLLHDAGADGRFAGASVARHGRREVICVPLAGRHGTVGVVFLDVAEGGGVFTDDHLQLAAAVAHLAAVAVEEARHYQQLLQGERLAAVGQAIAAMSHHIKNIMQGVRFGSDMVRMGLAAANDRELLVKGWRLVEKNQAKIDDLILDMLSYSKEREPSLEPTDLLALAAEVIDVVRGRAELSGVAIEWLPTELPLVTCDPDGVSQALLNVLSNAVDALSETESPRVAVTTSLADGFAEIAVADNGPGIPAGRAGDLFRPFVSTKGSRGTGLGLPVSRKILREHGGDVTVESEPGRGATFRLLIPHPPKPPATPSEPPQE